MSRPAVGFGCVFTFGGVHMETLQRHRPNIRPQGEAQAGPGASCNRS